MSITVSLTQPVSSPGVEAKYTEWLGPLSDCKVFLELLYFRPEPASPYQTLMHLSAG